MIVAFVVAALLVPSAALGVHHACLKRGVAVDLLGKGFSEAPVAMGLANNGGVIELLSSKTGETWTIIITMPNGTACMIAAGENWETIPYQRNGKKS